MSLKVLRSTPQRAEEVRALAPLLLDGVPAIRVVPDGALELLQLEGIQVPRSGLRSPVRRPGRRTASSKASSVRAQWKSDGDATRES